MNSADIARLCLGWAFTMPAKGLPRPGVACDAPVQYIEPVALLPLAGLPLGPHATPLRRTDIAVPVSGGVLSLGERGWLESDWHVLRTGLRA